MDLLKHIKSEWAVIKGAFWSVLTLVLLSIGVTWAGTNALYSERISALETRIALKDDRIEILESEVSAYSDLERRMTEMEQRVSASKLTELRGVLGAGPAGLIRMHIWNGTSSDAEAVVEAFAESGWSVAEVVSEPEAPSTTQPFLVIGSESDPAASWALEAFSKAGIPYESSPERTAAARDMMELWVNADAIEQGNESLPK